MVDKDDIFQIGIGTWNINLNDIENEFDALDYSLSNGQNYFSLYMLYNNGENVKQVAKYIGEKDRDNLFITANLEPMITSVEDVEKQLKDYLLLLDTDYIDCLQIHSPLFSDIPLVDVYSKIKELQNRGLVRYIGVSNVTLNSLVEISRVCKVDFFEGVYNLDCKTYENNGVLDYCNKNDIKFICYQPLRRNKISQKNYDFLVELSHKYNKTQNQIMLNWIIKEKKILPLVKSTNVDRIRENIDALDFEMNREDYLLLSNFQNEYYNNIVIDWDGQGGITIDQLANQ